MLTLTSPSAGTMRASPMSWTMVLWLAQHSGWAFAPEFIRDGRPVRPGAEAGGAGGGALEFDDARAWSLAEALERALPDLPDHDAMTHKAAWTIDLPPWSDPSGRRLTKLRYVRSGEKVTPFEYFSGSNKDRIRRLIGFCRAGGFSVR